MSKGKRFLLPAVIAVALVGLVAGRFADHALQVSLAKVNSEVQASALANLSTASASVDPSFGLDAPLSPVELVWKVLKIIKDYYVEPINPFDNADMAHNAVRYMVASLGDPNSRFLDQKEVATLRDAADGKFHGIGAVLRIREKKDPDYTDQQLTVVAPLPGSPAEKAGLRPGDVITGIDGKWVMSHDPYSEFYRISKDYKATLEDKKKVLDSAEAMRKKAISIDDTADKLSSAQTGEITLTVDRGGKAQTLKVVPGQVDASLLESRMLPGSVGYIRVVFLAPETAKEFDQAVKGLKSKGAKSLVLDLRNCPGGSLAAAQAIAGELIPGRKLAVVLRSHGHKDAILAKPAMTPPHLPIVALINQGTEGASEVLAGGLRDEGKVKLIGANSWGNAFEQTAFRLADGTAYTLTTGKYLTPDGTNFNKTGLKPDATVPMDPAKLDTPGDTQLARAVLVAKRKTA